MIQYKMHKNAASRGKVTGHNRSWNPGQIITAPEGEFDHLPRVHYTVLEAEKAQLEPGGEKATFPPDDQANAINATDGAIALAKEHDIDLTSVTGTGADGRITKGDVEAIVNQ